MNFFKHSPLFLMLLVSGSLLTLAAFYEKDSVYGDMEYNPAKAPLLSMIFSGLSEEIYPWEMGEVLQETVAAPLENGEEITPEELTAGDATEAIPEAGQETEGASDDLPAGSEAEPAMPNAEAQALPLATEEPYVYGSGRIGPMRPTTDEEYRNHRSADIYGDVGVKKAAEYSFQTVEESYFDDALFIGDSRTVGLRDYSSLSQHADFCAKTSLSIYKVLRENYKGMGKLRDVLARRDYKKIYLMVGINELGTGRVEDYVKAYAEVIDTIHEWEPGAVIIMEATMRVGANKSLTDAIFKNEYIIARNNAIATLADNRTIFYVDVNEALCDETGSLHPDYSFDEIHLLAPYYEVWKNFLLSHAVQTE